MHDAGATAPGNLTPGNAGPARSTPVAEPRVFGLDVLRALAVGAVVFAHSSPFFAPVDVAAHTHLAHAMFLASHVGVEMFFVLSGFLIGRILLRDPVRDLRGLWRFWARRWLRTLPPYYLVLAVLALALPPGREVLLRYFAFLQCARLEYLEPVFFPVSWSLAVEEWFYLGLPLVLVLARSRLWPVLALLLAASAVRWLLLWDADFAAAKYFTWLRFDALLWGVLAAGLSLHAPAVWQRLRTPAAAIAVAGGATVVAMFWLLPQQHVAMRGPLFTLTSLTFACTLPLAAAWRARPGVIVGVVSWLAAISYPLYLVHLELLQAAATAFGGWGAVPGIGGALLLAWGMHRLLERPLLAWRDRRVRARDGLTG